MNDTARAAGARRAAAVHAAEPPVSPGLVLGFLILADLAVTSLVGLGWWAAYVGPAGPELASRYAVVIALGVMIFGLSHYLSGEYSLARLRRLNRRFWRVISHWTLALAALVLLGFALKMSSQFSRVFLFGWWLGGAVGLILVRLWFAQSLTRLTLAGQLGERIAIVGAGEHGRLFARHMAEHRCPFQRLVGVYDDRGPGRRAAALEGLAVRGTAARLIADARRGRVDTVVLALPWSARDRLRSLIAQLEEVAVDVRIAPDLIGFDLPERRVALVGALPTLSVWDRPMKDWHALAKALEDKLISGLALIVLAPVFAMIALAIKLESPGPVLFRQQRFGFNNEPIEVLKFRSMYVDRQDVSGAARTVKGDPRVTRVGRLIRRTSIDELPQLINVWRGEMSVVGPRPHAVSMRVGKDYYFHAVRGYAARHRVKPGITGWAQVNDLRGEIDTLEKARRRVEFDLHYVNNWSLAFDLRIIVATLVSLLTTRNAY
ncbi:MAG: undecaprenyl-phosphate glucose phosphotransferase [Rhodothalassiaceae bacterium]